MPDRPSFPVPDDLTPETYCLQIEMPNDPTWKAVIAGLLWQPAEWFNWQRDEARSGKELAQYWRKIYECIDWSDMSCCCVNKNDSPTGFYRENAAGQMETSSDGGVTWVVNTTQDYRVNSGQFPPLSADALGADAKCQSANNVLAYLQHSQAKYDEAWTASGDIGALVAAVLALIQEIGLLGGFSALTIAAAGFPYMLVLGVVVAAYYFGRSAWAASFSDPFWAEVLCAIYCNIGDDGYVSTGQFTTMLAKIDAIGFSAARLYIWAVVNSMGSVGLTNAARTMSASVESCEDCVCGDYIRIYVSTGGGTETLWDGEWLYASPVHDGSHYTLFCQVTNPSGAINYDDCGLFEYEVLTGTVATALCVSFACHTYAASTVGLTPMNEYCSCQVAIRNEEDAPFTVRVRALTCT